MNDFTTTVAWSRTEGTGGSAGAEAVHRAPPRKKVNAAPLGAHDACRYVPLASFVRLEPSGRACERSVSLPSKIASWLDQLASTPGTVPTVLPFVSAIAMLPSAPEYMSWVASGDQPEKAALDWPSWALLAEVKSSRNRFWPSRYVACVPSGAIESTLTTPVVGSAASSAGPLGPCV